MMLSRYLMLAVAGALTLFFLYLSIENLHSVTLTVFGAAHELPVGFLLLAGLLLGGLTGTSIARVLAASDRREKKKLEWDTQDAKLAAEVKSDREKQLEAKIATLESALKTALNKR